MYFRESVTAWELTAAAQFRLRLRQQVLLRAGMVGTVAVHASDIITEVRRGPMMALILALAVTLQASLARLRAREHRRSDDLRFVPPPATCSAPGHDRTGIHGPSFLAI